MWNMNGEAETEQLADEDGPTHFQSGKDTHNMTISVVYEIIYVHFPYEDLSQHRYFMLLVCICLDKDVA